MATIKMKWIIGIVGLLLIIGTILYFSIGKEGVDEVSTPKISLGIRSNQEWDTIINQKTMDDATTECFGEKVDENGHHTLLCTKLAGSDTELGFKTFFKTKVQNYKITEIVNEPITRIVKRTIDYGEIECPKDSKNTSCYGWTFDEGTEKTDYKRTEYQLDVKNEDINDWAITTKQEFEKGEERLYKIEWDDFIPTYIQPSIIQISSNEWKATFPQRLFYENELSINPTQSYNYTDDNWAGIYWQTEDLSGKIVLTRTTPYSGTLAGWGYTGAVDTWADGWARRWNNTLVSDTTFENEGLILELWGGEWPDTELSADIAVSIGVGINITDAYTNITNTGTGCYDEWHNKDILTGTKDYACNITNWFETITYEAGWNIWFITNGTNIADGVNSFAFDVNLLLTSSIHENMIIRFELYLFFALKSYYAVSFLII